MASSNRHWPRMFKSKPCNQPWHHEITTPPPMLSSSTTCHKSPYTSGCEERTLEPKPRWNPKPEQIQILEAIFNSGMINPPREEIHRIRLQLQQYGQVGDANVFYWFQNRKSRTKNKNRHLLSSRANNRSSTGTGGAANTSVIPITGIATPNIGILANANIPSSNSNSIMTSPLTNLTVPITMTTQTSSSSSSERSSGSSKPLKPVHVPMSVPEPVTMYNNIHCSTELSTLSEPFLFQNPNGYCFSIPELTGLIAAPSDQVTSVGLGLWNEPIGHGIATAAATGTEDHDDHVGVKRKNNIDIDGDELHLHQYRFGIANDGLLINNGGESDVKIGLHHDCCFEIQPTDHVAVVPNSSSSAAAAAESVVTAAVETGAAAAADDHGGACAAATTLLYCAPVNVMQDNSGGRGGGTGRLTVFIDEKPYQVPTSPLNVKSAFGNFVLVHSSGYPVPTDELHNTLQPLQHGASYYLVPICYV